jgi:hypothetical protein
MHNLANTFADIIKIGKHVSENFVYLRAFLFLLWSTSENIPNVIFPIDYFLYILEKKILSYLKI